jgi:hypothetical protein
MESANPHTIGSVLLTRERRCPDHVTGYTDPPQGFNSVRYRPGDGFYGGSDWQDYEDIPRYVTLRDHVIGARNYSLTTSLRSRQDAFRKLRPLDYDLVLAARKAAAKGLLPECIL